ncbi:DUF3519 domain-containing protein [Helicobacter pylori]|uniref:PBECR3 domain-containing polyvalent protein n=1 Tax=Helicobacter pylori TaxID=210 RepID=UPI003C6D150C
MLSERVKMLFVFLFFSFGCLSVNFLEHLNKPHFCGFVAGAFYKEGLGDIDLVWGNKDYGLEHILKRRIESYIKKGLKDFKIADVTKDMFNPDSKEFKDIDIYDFAHYLLMANREPNENNPTLKRLIEAVKDMQKETKKGIKQDYSDTSLNNDEIKALLNNAEIPTSGRDAVIFGKNNLTPEIVEFLHKNNKRMIIEKASNKEVELLQNANFRHPEDVRASLDHDAIAHILKRHGVNSVNVRNGEIPITYEDIANYRDVVNNADEIIRSIGKGNKENITAFKQVNGYAVVVEQAVNRNSELVLKTMFKSNGDYKNNNAYKKFSSTGLNANAKVQP